MASTRASISNLLEEHGDLSKSPTSSSSSIDYTPKSPTSSTSPSTNGYLNSPTSPPPRVPPPPLIQESRSIDITLTLSPITLLSLVIPLLGTFLKLMKIHACVAFTTRGVLPSNSKAKENNGGKKVIKGSLLGDLAKRVKNIDGKMLCKDGNHRNLTVAIMGNLGNDTVGSGSFAAMVHGRKQDYEFLKRLLNMEDGEDRGHKVENSDFVLPKYAMDNVKSRYENSLVGYFIGKNLAFPIFESKTGMDQVLERGPWTICKFPIILTKWSPSLSLKKGEVTKVPVWVKLHGVPVLAYSDDGLSLIATQIGNPIMLNAFTSTMCVES
ncbi:hypothetical protein Tco_0754354 [Tanacetum coccineum]